MIRLFVSLLLCLSLATAQAQSPIRAFPPGTFDNVAARAPAGGGGTAPTILNASDKASNLTVDGGGLGVSNDNSGDWSVIRSVASYSSGKKYFEAKLTFAGGNYSVGIGVANSSLAMSAPNGSGPGQTTNSIAVFNHLTDTNIYYNNVSQGNISAAIAQGDWICVALDLDNGKIWFRLNGGNWNNNGSADPATNTGGITVSVTGALYAMVSANRVASFAAVEVNFGATAYAQAVPSGFSNWEHTWGGIASVYSSLAFAKSSDQDPTTNSFSQDIGGAFANRRVIVVISTHNTYDASFSAFTINGVTATLREDNGTFGGFSAFRGRILYAYADVPTGSAYQVISFSGGTQSGNGSYKVATYVIDKTVLVNGSPSFGVAENDAVTSLAVSTNTAAGGFVIATIIFDFITPTASASSVTSSTQVVDTDVAFDSASSKLQGPFVSKKSAVSAATPWSVTYSWTGASQAFASMMHWH